MQSIYHLYEGVCQFSLGYGLYILYISGVQSCAMEGREYAGFHSNQSLHQLILLMNTSSIREDGTN